MDGATKGTGGQARPGRGGHRGRMDVVMGVWWGSCGRCDVNTTYATGTVVVYDPRLWGDDDGNGDNGME